MACAYKVCPYGTHVVCDYRYFHILIFINTKNLVLPVTTLALRCIQKVRHVQHVKIRVIQNITVGNINMCYFIFLSIMHKKSKHRNGSSY